ncbi:hypothetical protein [Streptomyces griseomycini]|uniref:Uncharacterized protein n=1 Tax=Streptomyces griseomycini TaxID=66895 RepID=A0A7W7PWI2_9ACTN|nr:hypothetical protein [Streptomyces griseomycini]MBB4902574.1 hypothetical protein [Streptomyces griseomycini]GGR54255.1 hypothetical protein GCM10015536_69450 [Streptomyces griseomycini]
MKTNLPRDDRQFRLFISFSIGCVVLALVLCVAFLAADATRAPSKDSSPGRCAPALAGTVDPVTCKPYGPGVVPGGSNPDSSARKPARTQPKAPAPAAPKVPAAPAVKAPPVRSAK